MHSHNIPREKTTPTLHHSRHVLRIRARTAITFLLAEATHDLLLVEQLQTVALLQRHLNDVHVCTHKSKNNASQTLVDQTNYLCTTTQKQTRLDDFRLNYCL